MVFTGNSLLRIDLSHGCGLQQEAGARLLCSCVQRWEVDRCVLSRIAKMNLSFSSTATLSNRAVYMHLIRCGPPCTGRFHASGMERSWPLSLEPLSLMSEDDKKLSGRSLSLSARFPFHGLPIGFFKPSSRRWRIQDG